MEKKRLHANLSGPSQYMHRNKWEWTSDCEKITPALLVSLGVESKVSQY